MNPLTDTYTLANDVSIPKIGFGTWQIPDGDDAYEATAAALEAGYRHVDTARAYGNEASVGRAIADSGIARDEVFVTTKLPAQIKSYDGAHESFGKSVAALGLDHVDLYLIHAPWPWDQWGADHATGNAEAWRAMEEIHDAGRSRSIGVSNFDVSDLEKLIGASRVTPHVNQIRLYVGHAQEETAAYCRARDILVEGYSPLATGSILGNEAIAGIAEQYGKTVAQLCIRYVLQKGALPLPKTTSPERMRENADVDFEIAEGAMSFLDGLTDAAN